MASLRLALPSLALVACAAGCLPAVGGGVLLADSSKGGSSSAATGAFVFDLALVSSSTAPTLEVPSAAGGLADFAGKNLFGPLAPEVRVGGRPVTRFQVVNNREADNLQLNNRLLAQPAAGVSGQTEDLEFFVAAPTAGLSPQVERISAAVRRVRSFHAAALVAPIASAVAPRHSQYLVLGDIDRDGDLDLVAAHLNDLARVYRNLGAGSFEVLDDNLSLGSFPLGLLLEDFDGDGYPDLLIAKGTSELRLNNRQGSFSTVLNLGIAARRFAAGDVDGDGDLDLACASFNSGCEIYLNNGAGTFVRSAELSRDQGVEGCALGDLDGDGDLDLTTFGAQSSLRLYLNNGGGHLHAGPHSGGSGPASPGGEPRRERRQRARDPPLQFGPDLADLPRLGGSAHAGVGAGAQNVCRRL